MERKEMTARAERLKEIRAITLACFERDALHRHLCPMMFDSEEDVERRKETLRSIAKLSQTISIHAYNIGRLERGALGFSYVLNRKPSEIETISLALMTAARLDVNASREVRTVADVCGLVASRDLAVGSEARSMFRSSDGSLFGLVTLWGVGLSLDERWVRLRESVFNRVLGLLPDALHEALSDVEVAVPERIRR